MADEIEWTEDPRRAHPRGRRHARMDATAARPAPARRLWLVIPPDQQWRNVLVLCGCGNHVRVEVSYPPDPDTPSSGACRICGAIFEVVVGDRT